MKLEVNSWVTLRAPKEGPWAKQGDIKAIIKGFKVNSDSGVVEAVSVVHAYSYKQLDKATKEATTWNVNCECRLTFISTCKMPFIDFFD